MLVDAELSQRAGGRGLRARIQALLAGVPASTPSDDQTTYSWVPSAARERRIMCPGALPRAFSLL